MTSPTRYLAFAQSNPCGPEQGDLPALLERVAATMRRDFDGIEVADIVASYEINEYGKWWSLVVYYKEA